MGGQQSKAVDPILLVNENPEINVSSDLIRRLDGSAEESFIKAVRERVDQELTIQRKLREAGIEHSANKAANELEELLKVYGSVPPAPKKSKECIEAEEKVILCYKNNSKRPLDCVEEVENFKNLVNVEYSKLLNSTIA